ILRHYAKGRSSPPMPAPTNASSSLRSCSGVRSAVPGEMYAPVPGNDRNGAIVLKNSFSAMFDFLGGLRARHSKNQLGDQPICRSGSVTGGAPGYFNRHFNIPALIQIAEFLRASGRQWPENATYNGGFFDKSHGAVREHAKAGNCGHLRHSPSRCLRVRALAIFVLPRMATT